MVDRFLWHANEWMLHRLHWLNAVGGRLSVVSQFTTPGDSLLTGTVGHILKQRWPRLRLNVVVHQPELLQTDPNFAEVNGPVGPWRLAFHYLSILADKQPDVNVLQPVMNKVGIERYDYRSRVYLTAAERDAARARLNHLRRPIVTINVISREPTKTWSMDGWRKLVGHLRGTYDLVQLGDASEPAFPGVTSFAGQLTLRESMAVLSRGQLHIGPVSFLMHAANGLDVPAVIIYGGRETPANSGYRENQNLFVSMPCGPCWLHENRNERCAYAMACMAKITPEQVATAVTELMARGPAPGFAAGEACR